MKLEIIICTEHGPLEKMSMLLIKSIRRIGGPFALTPIYSYQPRKFKSLNRETISFFEKYNVTNVTEPLNTEYENYPLANKPLACSHREEKSNADYLLFLDSDSMFLSFPSLLEEPLIDNDIAIAPVDFSNIATDRYFQKGDHRFWSNMYKELGIQPRSFIRTRIDNKKILEYYNSGFVLVKRQKGIFTNWLINFQRLMDKKIRPSDRMFFLEQSCLSATIAQMNLGVKDIGKSYNYPIGGVYKKWRGLYPFSLKNVKHIHYHKVFQNKHMPPRIKRKIGVMKDGAYTLDLIESFLLK